MPAGGSDPALQLRLLIKGAPKTVDCVAKRAPAGYPNQHHLFWPAERVTRTRLPASRCSLIACSCHKNLGLGLGPELLFSPLCGLCRSVSMQPCQHDFVNLIRLFTV